MKTILIQIQSGSDTTTFDIYTDSDSYTTPIHTNVSKNELENGYTSTIVPDNATMIKVSSNSIICPDQFILIPISTTTTTTTTTTTDPSESVIPLYPSYNGTWTISAIKLNKLTAFPSVRNNTNATTIYDSIDYDSGIINSNITEISVRVLINISRYYSKINIFDIINNGITTSNISSIKFRAYIEVPNAPLSTPVKLDLYEAGTNLQEGSLSNFRLYINNLTHISSPNVRISSLDIYDSGFYDFEFNTYGLFVINDRIQNNKDVVLAIVTRFDSDNIVPMVETPDVTIYYNSILGTDPLKYPSLNVTII